MLVESPNSNVLMLEILAARGKKLIAVGYDTKSLLAFPARKFYVTVLHWKNKAVDQTPSYAIDTGCPLTPGNITKFFALRCYTKPRKEQKPTYRKKWMGDYAPAPVAPSTLWNVRPRVQLRI